MSNANSLSADDSRFLGECIDIGLAGYREAVRSRSRSGRDYSIARTDNRIHRWRYEDSARSSTDAGVAYSDTDATTYVAANGNEYDDPLLLPSDPVAGQDAVLATESDAGVHAGATATTAADTGAVPSTGQRWSLASGLLFPGKDAP